MTTPGDFGLRGDPPSHPELLDHLAATFVADGWSVKRLVRRIVKVVAGRGDTERRLGYFFRSEAKYMAGLCDDDLDELVRIVLGAGKSRAPNLSGPHGSLRRRPK